MRRRRRDIVLDFTSLLDVTLIILFYFILFSRMDVAETQQAASEKIAEAASVSEDAERRIAEADEKLAEAEQRQQEADQARTALEHANAQSAANVEALLAFSEGDSLRVRIYTDSGEWHCIVRRGGTELAEIRRGDDTAAVMKKAMQEAGYAPNDTILCEFVYPADEAGSHAAYLQISEGLRVMQQHYPYLYLSETDLSE